MYETERKQLVSRFYEDRGSLQSRRIVYYENYAHAAVSFEKYKIYRMGEAFSHCEMGLTSACDAKLENMDDKAKTRETAACWEIKKLVNLFNNFLWPKDRLKKYQSCLKDSLEADKIAEDLGKCIKTKTKTVWMLEEKIKHLSNDHAMKVVEFKSEFCFLSKMMQEADKKIKTECLEDHMKTVNLVSLANETTKSLERNLQQGKRIVAGVKICSKLEKLSDKLQSPECKDSREIQTTDCNKFFQKCARIEAQCVLMKSYKRDLTTQNEILKAALESKSYENTQNQNFKILKLDSTPFVGQVFQVSHQISQIKMATKSKQKKLGKIEYPSE